MDLEAWATQQLETSVSATLGDSPDRPVETLAVEGQPAPVLLDAASDADLLVVGSHGHGRFAGMLMGSVSTTAWSTPAVRWSWCAARPGWPRPVTAEGNSIWRASIGRANATAPAAQGSFHISYSRPRDLGVRPRGDGIRLRATRQRGSRPRSALTHQGCPRTCFVAWRRHSRDELGRRLAQTLEQGGDGS